MRRIIIAMIALMPICAMAQGEWERPLTAAEKLEQAKRAEAEAKRAVKEAKKAAKKAAKEAKLNGNASAMPQENGLIAPPTTVSGRQIANEMPVATDKDEAPVIKPVNMIDKRYLAGAVPLVNGKVVFALDLDVPGKDAAEIYGAVFKFLDEQAQEECQKEESGITLFNKAEHIIAARFSEWLQFKKNTIMLDQTEFNYTIIANCSDGHLKMTMERISYVYEENRSDGIRASAETWITDERALNKKKTKLAPMTGKFRRKTIDRKNHIFNAVTNLLNH